MSSTIRPSKSGAVAIASSSFAKTLRSMGWVTSLALLIRLTAITRDVDPSLVPVDDVLSDTFYLSYPAVQP